MNLELSKQFEIQKERVGTLIKCIVYERNDILSFHRSGMLDNYSHYDSFLEHIYCILTIIRTYFDVTIPHIARQSHHSSCLVEFTIE